MKLTEAQQAKKQEILQEISDLLDNAYEAYEIAVKITIREVLEIIDTQLEAVADGKYGGATALRFVFEAVLALEGGEQE